MSLRYSSRRVRRNAIVATFAAAILSGSGIAAASVGADQGQSNDGGSNGAELSTIFSGATLGVSQPDDVTTMDGHVFVVFQNGVGPQGEPNPSTGGLDSTVVEMTPSGVVERTWTLVGHGDGLTADPQGHRVIATVNEDLNSSLYTIDPNSTSPVHYMFSPSNLPHNGGTDAISVIGGQIFVSASSPGTTGAPAPQPNYPAVYSVKLDSSALTATVTPVFSDEASAVVANAGPTQGQAVTLGLTDPDSNEVVPSASPRFAGDFVLDGQGDQQQVYVSDIGMSDQRLSVLNLSQSVNDTAWATAGDGSLYITDHANNLVDVLRGHFDPGTAFVAATPCNANTAPANCSTNFLGTVDLNTGTVNPVNLGGEQVQPAGLAFSPGSHDGSDSQSEG